MYTTNELRNQRARVWEQAKAFLDSHRDKNGILTAEDTETYERMEQDMLKKPVKVLHIVGGGSKNAMLNQFTANALGRPVLAGPGEGTVIGNLLMQGMALGAVSDLWQLRKVVEKSFPTDRFLPENTDQWDAAYARFLTLMR